MQQVERKIQKSQKEEKEMTERPEMQSARRRNTSNKERTTAGPASSDASSARARESCSPSSLGNKTHRYETERIRMYNIE